jgi:hypothetical protein
MNHGHKSKECRKAATREDNRCDDCREAEAEEATDDVRRLAGAGRIFFAYCKTCKEGEVPLYAVPDSEKDPFAPADSKTAACPNCGAQHTYRPSEMHLGEG